MKIMQQLWLVFSIYLHPELRNALILSPASPSDRMKIRPCFGVANEIVSFSSNILKLTVVRRHL